MVDFSDEVKAAAAGALNAGIKGSGSVRNLEEIGAPITPNPGDTLQPYRKILSDISKEPAVIKAQQLYANDVQNTQTMAAAKMPENMVNGATFVQRDSFDHLLATVKDSLRAKGLEPDAALPGGTLAGKAVMEIHEAAKEGRDPIKSHEKFTAEKEGVARR